MSGVDVLADLFRQIRSNTIHILESADAGEEFFAPDGTSNHMIWHCGHAIWVQDFLCLQLLEGVSELPDGWADTYGMNCRPVAETTDWLNRTDMLSALDQQRERILNVLAAATNEQLERVADPAKGPLTVSARIIHGCHDEAKHSGEMYLLLKLFRASM